MVHYYSKVWGWYEFFYICERRLTKYLFNNKYDKNSNYNWKFEYILKCSKNQNPVTM